VSFKRLKKFMLPSGPILVLTLVGLMFTSALLYYKAVRAQRYLEPSLSIAQPRIDFMQDLRSLLEKEFGAEKVKGIVLVGHSVFVDGSLIFSEPVLWKTIDGTFLKKLGKVFLSMLEDPDMRSQFDLILVNTRMKVSPEMAVNVKKRNEKQYIAESIMNALYEVDPNLLKYYDTFTATAIPVQPSMNDGWVEFRIVPSEHLHIELMKSLGKYMF
jgi:hypothetical protein